MAKPKKPKPGDNSKQGRLVTLDEKLSEWVALQKEENRLIELHIKPIRDKKNAVKASAKADLEIPTAAFNARAGLRMIELEGDDDVVLATNEMFKATPVGKNLDLVAVAQRVKEREKEREKEEAAKEKAKAEKLAAKAKAADSEDVAKPEGGKRVH